MEAKSNVVIWLFNTSAKSDLPRLNVRPDILIRTQNLYRRKTPSKWLTKISIDNKKNN